MRLCVLLIVVFKPLATSGSGRTTTFHALPIIPDIDVAYYTFDLGNLHRRGVMTARISVAPEDRGSLDLLDLMPFRPLVAPFVA
jgi:hypothetical protein